MEGEKTYGRVESGMLVILDLLLKKKAGGFNLVLMSAFCLSPGTLRIYQGDQLDICNGLRTRLPTNLIIYIR